MALAQSALPQRPPGLLFDVVVHLGTLVAILVILRARVARLLGAAFALASGRPAGDDATERRWLLLLVVGSVPTAALGLGLRALVERVHGQPFWVGVCLLATAAILVASERWGRRSRGAEAFGVSDALLIGTVQGLAVLPGISRSGATVGTALLRDARAEPAVEFSMLLSVPAILGANALELFRAGLDTVRAELLPLAVGFASALVTGALCLKALQWIVARRALRPFAVYCALLGAGAMVLG